MILKVRAAEESHLIVPSSSSRLPQDVSVFALDPHPDGRGAFSEIFRDEWSADIRLIQWNLVHSAAGVLRGMHVHRRHSDYLTLAAGRMILGLCDLRRTSPTYRVAAALELTPAKAILIPAGVAHGFYFGEAAIHIYAVTHYWDPEDELGCHWSDPGLQIPWEVRNPVLSDRDAGLPSLARLVKDLA